MRSAKVQDYWRKAYKREYKNSILTLDLKGLNNLAEIELSKGVVAFCGLNGAGKSTIISAIKDLVGLSLTSQDVRRVNEHKIEGTAAFDRGIVSCTNCEQNRFFDKGMETSSVKYIDSMLSALVQSFMIEQANFEELLDQYDEYEVTKEELGDINYLTGKAYSYCSIREIEDADGSDLPFPFFQVKIDGIEYDTRSMGSGEHFLLYLFWCIKSADKDTLLIIEEPETYISIFSQIHFADYIGKILAEDGIKVILTTHSPYILRNIKNENIRIVSRMGNNVSIIMPDNDITVEGILGISPNCLGTLFVEDRVAADFLTVILEDKAPWILKQYSIDIVDGESAISERLKFPKSNNIHYSFIGIYDGDMRNSLTNRNELNWSYCFLPGENASEENFRESIRAPEKLEKLCATLEKDSQKVIAFLATIEGLDCHDWFLELRKHLSVEGRVLVNAFYSTVMNEDPSIEEFISALQRAIETNG